MQPEDTLSDSALFNWLNQNRWIITHNNSIKWLQNVILCMILEDVYSIHIEGDWVYNTEIKHVVKFISDVIRFFHLFWEKTHQYIEKVEDYFNSSSFLGNSPKKRALMLSNNLLDWYKR